MLLFHRFCQINLLLLSKWRKKQVKPWGGVLMDKQNHPTFPYRPPNLLFPRWATKKSLPAFANLWLLLVNFCISVVRLNLYSRHFINQLKVKLLLQPRFPSIVIQSTLTLRTRCHYRPLLRRNFRSPSIEV